MADETIKPRARHDRRFAFEPNYKQLFRLTKDRRVRLRRIAQSDAKA